MPILKRSQMNAECNALVTSRMAEVQLSGISLDLPSDIDNNHHSVYSLENNEINVISKSPAVKFSDATTDSVSTITNAKDRDSKGSQRSSELRQRKSTRFSTSFSRLSTDLKSVEFLPPDEGTPAAEALAANAAIKVSRVTKGLKKLRGLKRPKMKNLNLVKQLNKKTKRKKRHFSKNFKGKVIDGVHELYTLTAGMMLGIRYSVGKLNGPSGEAGDNLLTIADFSYVEKVTFPPQGSEAGHITPPHQLAHTFKFKSYCPKIFKRLRDFFDTDAASYMLSVCGDYNFIEFISNSKSGQFFFYSHDGKYMIKTQTKEENKFLKRILPHYYKYLSENPHSTIVRIFGMYRVKMYHIRRKVHFVIMVSVFDTPAQINTIYDLKGSSVGRSVTKAEREKGAVLKDNDLLEDGRKIHLGYKKDQFIQQLRRDTDFLASLNIMDYSLLVGIHDRKTRGMELSAAALSSSSSNPPAHPEENGKQKEKEKSRVQFALAADPAASISSDEEEGHAAAEQSPTKEGSQQSPNHPPSPGGVTRRLSLVSRSNTPFRRVSYSAVTQPQPAAEDQSSAHKNPRLLKGSGDELQDFPAGIAENDEEGDDDEEEDDECDEEDDNDDEEEFEDIDEGDSADEGGPTGLTNSEDPRTVRSSVFTTTENKVGEGALGQEGYRLSTIFRPSQLQSSLSRSGSRATDAAGRTSESTPTRTNFSRSRDSLYLMSSPAGPVYSPGLSSRKPWTTRADGGINSRLADGRHGDEIYYIGIIDILQQYNLSKKAETFFKGFTNDVSKLSSVDSFSYAKRFMSFMEKNFD